MESFEASLEKRHYLKHIFVHSSGLYRNESGDYFSSEDALIRYAAAAALWTINSHADHQPSITVTGGEVYKGHPDLSKIGQQELINVFHIPEENVTTVGGNNTIRDFRLIHGVIEKKGLNPADVSVISSDYHLIAKLVSLAYRIPFASAEKTLVELKPEYAPAMIEILNSRANTKRKLSQLALVPFLLIPPVYEYISDWSKRKVQPQNPPASLLELYQRFSTDNNLAGLGLSANG